jgi:CSLREA domain-containing protein
VQVNITGTDSLGNPVSTQAFTDINGNYAVSLNPGTYSVSPTQPSNQAQGHYVPTTCSGTVSGSACQGLVLSAGGQATASFKLVTLVVNSTADTDNPTQAALGICDVTPGAPQQTCTLRQAIEVANTLGGGSITFNIPGGGVPTIVAQTLLPGLSTPITIDGTTQPGVGVVALRAGGTTEVGLSIGSTAVTVRGMKIDGFANSDLALGEGSGSDVIDQNQIDTVPGLPAPQTTAIDEFLTAGHNTFQQTSSAMRPLRHSTRRSTSVTRRTPWVGSPRGRATRSTAARSVRRPESSAPGR